MVVTQMNWFWVFVIMSVVWAQVGGQIVLALLAYFSFKVAVAYCYREVWETDPHREAHDRS